MAYTREVMLENLRRAREIRRNNSLNKVSKVKEKVKLHINDHIDLTSKIKDELSHLSLPKGKGKTGYFGVMELDNTRRKAFGSKVKINKNHFISYFSPDEVGLHNAITVTKKLMWDNNMGLLDLNNNQVFKESNKMELITISGKSVLTSKENKSVMIDELLNNHEVKAYRLATALMTLKTLNVKFRAISEDGVIYGDLPPEIKEVEVIKNVPEKRSNWKKEELRVLLSAMEKKDALRLELIDFSNGSNLRISSLHSAACLMLTELFGKENYKTHKSLIGEAVEVSRN